MLHSYVQAIFTQHPNVNKTIEAQDFICHRNTKHKIITIGSKYNYLVG